MLTIQTQPPKSQKAGDRPISFILAGYHRSEIQEYKFVIRPEELTRVDPSRVTVHQTLGGESLGWADSFGKGLPTINISGNTGWRVKHDSGDGLDRMIKLKAQIDAWHEIRQQRINAGSNPDETKLIFVDTLDQFAVHVVPIQFVLRRSKSRPLLAQFNISMAVISPDIDSSPFLPAPVKPNMPSVIDGFLGAIGRITKFLNDTAKWIDKNILGPVKAFAEMTRKIMNAVIGMIRSGVNVVARVILTAREIAQAGMNIARSISAILDLPSLAKQQLSKVATEYSSIFCLTRNALGITPYYDDYSSVYGASNCSSTAGGRPPSIYANTNTFAAITPETDSTVTVSSAAQSSLAALTRTDPVLSPMSQSELLAHTNNVVAGVAI
ncbi:hypothetical protein [Nitrosomonas sp. Nm132]|uniref:hypothetical protein n=1 Tax=Nitrosomonas sp. Nm132 TaxID=1881053 RepID=UPI00088734AE|nr:hypothetical protein [Nitrosomonas sp. Nm132]SDH27650.1 hypothetical protein SAMN05428952_100991 [Nitrosomonas sp. Nm132]